MKCVDYIVKNKPSPNAMKNNQLNSFSRIFIVLFVAASCCVTIGCDDNNDATPAAPTPAVKVKLGTSATLGSYLTDADGNALYFFSNDAAGQNTCTGGCATNWPIYNAGSLAAENLATGLDLADFGTVTVGTATQSTYKGWPLYYYAPGGTREAAGQTTGEAVGTVWFVAKTDYTFMVANAQLIGLDGKSYKGDYTEGEAKVKYFTDAHGRTVYGFTHDKKNDNNFTTGDAAHDASWPIYGATMGSLPSTLDKALFGTITVNGATQLTYKGWPLYYFKNDAVRGDNKGVSVPTPGVWPVVVQDIVAAPE
jgi:predicted lipoprotein with Yx(FWY)xxD motif